jgi:DNA-directed RNA polymerase subunit E'/Rpb7
MEVFNKILCKENIKLEPKFISRAFAIEVKKRLINKVEGKCTKHGYIKHNSVEIYKLTPGVVELISLAGHVVYTAYFYADVCNPMLGNFVKATISNINRFGILAEAGYYLENQYISVLEIIIAKNSINIQSDVDLESLKIGDEVKVEIIGKKFELGETKMSAIGKIINEIVKNNPKKIDNNGDNDEEEEEAYEEKSDDDDDEEDEENENENDDDDDDEKQGGGSEDFFDDEEDFFSNDEEEDDDEEGIIDDKDESDVEEDLDEDNNDDD